MTLNDPTVRAAFLTLGATLSRQNAIARRALDDVAAIRSGGPFDGRAELQNKPECEVKL
jgi:hypothetical protein